MLGTSKLTPWEGASMPMPRRLSLALFRGGRQLCYDSRILSEYREVLARPKFGLDPAALDDFLEQVEADGLPVDPVPLARRLPDPADEAFLEVAIAGRAVCLVTGNLRCFPANRRCGVRVLSPALAVDLIRSRAH